MNEDKAARYHRLRRQAGMLGTGAVAAVLLLSGPTGLSVWLRDLADTLAAGSRPLAVVVFVACLGLLVEVVQLPLAYYRAVTLERRYGLSTEAKARWWTGHLTTVGTNLLVSVAAASVIAALLRAVPDWWWVICAALFSMVLVGLAQLAPALLPLLDDLRPLSRPSLGARLAALATRTGTPVVDVREWRVSGRTRRASATLAGVGASRRILVSDTLLADHSDEEIEVIIAHELSHHVHHDIWVAMALEVGLALLGFFVADRALRHAGPWLGLSGPADLAGLPLLAVTAGAVSLALVPVAHAVSRAQERRADRFALDTTGNPGAFVSAMRRLGANNLAEERPSALVELLFHSHPSVASRIAAATAWTSPAAGKVGR